MNYVDPTGHSWLSAAFHDSEDYVHDHSLEAGVGLQLLGGVFFIPGSYLLTKSETGRDILAGEIVVATAAATVACDGCGVGIGATMGEAFGAYGASRSGGSYLTGVSIGGLSGALGGAAGEWAGGLNTFGGAVSAGAVGGFTQGFGYTLAYGGNMQQAWTAGYQGAFAGAAIGAAAWGLNEIFRDISSVSIDPSTKNTISVTPRDASIFPKYAENIFGSDNVSWCNPGTSLCSRVGNLSPWGQAISIGHDGMVSSSQGAGYTFGQSNWINIPRAVVLSIGASVREFPSAPLTIDQKR
jgi:hypothetical protein